MAIVLPEREDSTAVNMGSNSVSSNTSAPIAGQPKAIASNSSTLEASNSEGPNTDTSAPFSLIPSSTAFAIASVLPVPLQYTTATLLI